ncbi:MAG: FUSC family protein [Chthoniobacterales bacterium]
MSKPFKSEILFTTLAIAAGTFLLGFLSWRFRATDPLWAIISFVLVYDPDMRSAFSSGFSRLVHTLLGVLIALAAIYVFGLHKWLLPLSLGISALICGVFLHFHTAWRVVLVTVALIIGASLLQPTAGLDIAISRAVEVSAGSLLAIIFSSLASHLRPQGDEEKN